MDMYVNFSSICLAQKLNYNEALGCNAQETGSTTLKQKVSGSSVTAEVENLSLQKYDLDISKEWKHRRAEVVKLIVIQQ